MRGKRSRCKQKACTCACMHPRVVIKPTQLGSLVNNGGVTQSRCLSTERAPPPSPGLVEICVQDAPVLCRGSTTTEHVHAHNTAMVPVPSPRGAHGPARRALFSCDCVKVNNQQTVLTPTNNPLKWQICPSGGSSASETHEPPHPTVRESSWRDGLFPKT